MKYIVIIPHVMSHPDSRKAARQNRGEEMITRVCRQVEKAGVEAVVATDDSRIRECVEKAGFRAVMTSDTHRSGTERVEEAYRLLGSDADVVINVQGDEPFIRPEQIEKLKAVFENNPSADIATLAMRFDATRGFDALFDPNLVKVVFSQDMDALYFSRSIIPYVRKRIEKLAERDRVPYAYRYLRL